MHQLTTDRTTMKRSESPDDETLAPADSAAGFWGAPVYRSFRSPGRVSGGGASEVVFVDVAAAGGRRCECEARNRTTMKRSESPDDETLAPADSAAGFWGAPVYRSGSADFAAPVASPEAGQARSCSWMLPRLVGEGASARRDNLVKNSEEVPAET
jgi:hypothetical protein